MSTGTGNNTTVTIDDRDPRVIYSHGWFHQGSRLEYNGTTTATFTKGANFRFTFHGTFVAVVGTIQVAGYGNTTVAPVSTYTIDGGTPTVFNPTLDAQLHRNATFYSSPTLQDDEHTLTVTCITDTIHFWFDYLLVSPTVPNASSATPKPAMRSTGSNTSTGVIVGGVIGGLGGLAIIALVLLIILRRWRGRQMAAGNPDTQPQPFTSQKPRPPSSLSSITRDTGHAALGSCSSSDPSQAPGSLARSMPQLATATLRTDFMSIPGSASRASLSGDPPSIARSSTVYMGSPPPSYSQSMPMAARVTPVEGSGHFESYLP
ncbi:hypothetical protein HGRIS_006804 [Hohenbuehelia grisea]|uniref:Uncharacterized protein n=1 Tax=Hohenbuehelia grisea TaxID=104357 RepID=A0ABR3JA28_9AGAR